MPEGFFSDMEIGEAIAPATPRLRACGACKLNKGCLSPAMPATGGGELGILVVEEAPGEKEDRLNTQLVGKAGQFLRRLLKEQDIDLDQDCRKINAVNCRPKSNRPPTDKEIACCRPMLREEVKKHPPHLVLLLGSCALHAWWGDRTSNIGSIGRWCGFVTTDMEYGCWVAALHHPSFLMRPTTDTVATIIFQRQLENALLCLDKPRPKSRKDYQMVRLLNDKQARTLLHKLVTGPQRTVAFDYETTGLKPHREGHRVVSCAIATSRTKAFAFLISPELQKPMRAFLTAKHVRKIAANFKFEEAWSRVFFHTRVRGWCWDTMICAHALDNRPDITSVKFQAWARYGVVDYEEQVKGFLRGAKKGGNEFNRIDKVPPDTLLYYNGLDALYEYWLAKDQQKEIAIA